MMDLFTPIVPEDKQHPNFRMISSPGLCPNELNVIKSWAEGFVDRDGKLVREFQTTFNSTFWELYLHAAFKELGFTIDFSEPAPDFLLAKGGYSFVAEATTTSHPDGFTAEWERDISLEALEKLDRDEVVNLATVRLASAIATKHRKYQDSYGNLSHVAGKPFVICLAPFEQPFFFQQNDNALRRVLYGFDEVIWFDLPESQSRIICGESGYDSFEKASGTEVEVGFFRDNRMKEISAVIFSSTATFSKVRALCDPGEYPVLFIARRYNSFGTEPLQVAECKNEYREQLLDGLYVCLNPYADRPLRTDDFLNREVCIQTLNIETGEYLIDTPHGFLFQRGCLTFPPAALTEAVRKQLPEVKPMTPHNAPPWKEGELHSVTAQVGPFADHYLAHYKGWTILIVQDSIDGDWGTQAISAKVKTVAQWIRLNRESSAEHVQAYEFYSSKEGALVAMLEILDSR